MKINQLRRLPSIPGWPEVLSKMAYDVKVVAPFEDVSTFETEEYRFFTHCISYMQAFDGASQNFQDAWAMYRRDRNKTSPKFFVEFGALDGVYGSNTLRLQKGGWHGILCEPNPNWKESLTRVRQVPGFIDVETDYCITGRTGDQVSFLITEKPDFSTIEKYQNSDYNASHRKENVQSVVLPTISLNDLLRKYAAPTEIDFMSVDTEGSELEILNAFNFDEYYVRQICVEHNYVEDTRSKIHDLMTANGYIREFVEFSRWDDFYIKKECV